MSTIRKRGSKWQVSKQFRKLCRGFPYLNLTSVSILTKDNS